MQRFSLANLVLPIGYRQFVRMAGHFIGICEEAFGCSCEVTVRCHAADRVFTTFAVPEALEAVEEANRSHLLHSGEGLPSRHEWDSARHVEFFVRPGNPHASLRHAFAHAEFKGVRPRQATFYVQCADYDVASAMRERWPRMLAGNGHKGNGVNWGLVPADSVKRFGLLPPDYRPV